MNDRNVRVPDKIFLRIFKSFSCSHLVCLLKSYSLVTLGVPGLATGGVTEDTQIIENIRFCFYCNVSFENKGVASGEKQKTNDLLICLKFGELGRS